MADEGYVILSQLLALGSGGVDVGANDGYAKLKPIVAYGHGGAYGSGQITIIAVGNQTAVSYGSGAGVLSTIRARGYSYISSYGDGYGLLKPLKALGSGDYVSEGTGYGELQVLRAFGNESNLTILVLNTDTGEGPFPYSNFDFNSIFESEGRIFLTSSLGLFELTGTDDNGTDITAYFETVQDDFGISEMKNIPEIIVGLKGQVSLKTTHDGHYSSAHSLNNTNNHLISKRAKLGLGMRQRYWGVRVTNVAGSSFQVDELELPVIVQGRKINQ